MNEEEIERRLGDAFASRAYGAVDENAVPPPLQLNRPASHRPHRVLRVLAPLTAAAAVAGVAVAIATHQSTQRGDTAALQPPASSAVSTAASTHVAPAATPVQVKLAMSQGEQVGVGMPVVAYFSRRITDGRALQSSTTVTVDGKPVQAAWYFVPSSEKGYPLEGHLRMESYWPAHSLIIVSAPVTGMSAGSGLAFAAGFRLQFATGARTVATVLESKHLMSVERDGTQYSFPVSLGASATPTMSGIKVVMQKGASICMTGPGYSECGVKYTQRLSTSGEYLLAADWNNYNIAHGIDSSNGCTNLTKSDAARLYGLMEVGDVVAYPDAKGTPMKLTDGLGDWNVSWSVWRTGGLVPTR